MKKDYVSKKRKLPTIDHGIDIVGDEWDEEIIPILFKTKKIGKMKVV